MLQKILTTYRFSLFILFLLFSQIGQGQYITQISSAWSDNLQEWIIISDDEDVEGFIEMKWAARNDPSWWVYTLGDLTGDIKKKWENDPNLWEIRSSDGSLITARTAWSNDFSEWIFTVDGNKFRLRSIYKNIVDEWEVKKDDSSLRIYTAIEGDPRDWIIEDYLEGGTLPLSIAVSFLVILHSVGI